MRFPLDFLAWLVPTTVFISLFSFFPTVVDQDVETIFTIAAQQCRVFLNLGAVKIVRTFTATCSAVLPGFSKKKESFLQNFKKCSNYVVIMRFEV
jgi:hypothetical protein